MVPAPSPFVCGLCLDSIFFGFWHCNTFVFIWQTLSNYGVTRLKTFVSRFTCKLCNWFLFSFIFNAPCICRKIRCDDGKSWKVFGFWSELNKALMQFCLFSRLFSPSLGSVRQAESVRYSTVFFCHNKSTDNTFNHNFLNKLCDIWLTVDLTIANHEAWNNSLKTKTSH